jgi:TPR repeat protein
MVKPMGKFDSPEVLAALDAIENRNYSRAFELLLPIANAGNPKAQCNLATLYQAGWGVNADGLKAVELYLHVAEQQIVEECLSGVAYNNLATIYSTGLRGIMPDPEKAKVYHRRAEALGFTM